MGRLTYTHILEKVEYDGCITSKIHDMCVVYSVGIPPSKEKKKKTFAEFDYFSSNIHKIIYKCLCMWWTCVCVFCMVSLNNKMKMCLNKIFILLQDGKKEKRRRIGIIIYEKNRNYGACSCTTHMSCVERYLTVPVLLVIQKCNSIQQSFSNYFLPSTRLFLCCNAMPYLHTFVEWSSEVRL